MVGEDYSTNSEEKKLSKINPAAIINITIENLWKDCYNALAKSDYVTWNRKLDSIWLILGGDVTDKDGFEKKIDEIDKKIYGQGSLNHKRKGFEGIEEDEQIIMNFQYLFLKKKSLLLRKIQNKQGKGTAYHSDEDYDID